MRIRTAAPDKPESSGKLSPLRSSYSADKTAHDLLTNSGPHKPVLHSKIACPLSTRARVASARGDCLQFPWRDSLLRQKVLDQGGMSHRKIVFLPVRSFQL